MPADPREPPAAPSAPEGDAPGAIEPLEPGAPIPPDAVDPELLRLPQPRLTRHPGVALAVVLLGGLLCFRLRADLAYSLQSDAPQELGAVRDALAAGRLVPGSYARIAGMPDYRNALAFDARGARARSTLFRVLGSDSRVLVVAGEDPGPAPQSRFAGRLRRLDDLSYAETLRGYFQERAAVLRALDLGAVAAAPAGALALAQRDRAGQPLALAPQTELLLQVVFPDDVRVLLSKDKFPAEADAARDVARLGLPQGPGVETRDGFGYVLRLPSGPARQQTIVQIDGRGYLYQARVETYRAPVAQLKLGGGALELPGPAALPQPARYAPGAPPQDKTLTEVREAATRLLLAPSADGQPYVDAMQVREALRPPADALVLVSGESPGSLRPWLWPLFGLLLAFMGFNLWYLATALGQRQKTS